MHKLLLGLVIAATSCISLAQSSLLLEACNNIPDTKKRLLCLQELIKLAPKNALATPPQVPMPAPVPLPADSPVTPAYSVTQQAAPNTTAIKRLFVSMQAAVKAGLSLNQYQSLVLELAKEIAIFKSENPSASPKGVDRLEMALRAYQDGETIWHAKIFDSIDGGLFVGRILPVESNNFEGLIRRYGLPTGSFVFTKTLLPEESLTIIWTYALDVSKHGFRYLDEMEGTGLGGSSSVELAGKSLSPGGDFYGLEFEEKGSDIVVTKVDKSPTWGTSLSVGDVVLDCKAAYGRDGEGLLSSNLPSISSIKQLKSQCFVSRAVKITLSIRTNEGSASRNVYIRQVE